MTTSDFIVKRNPGRGRRHAFLKTKWSTTRQRKRSRKPGSRGLYSVYEICLPDEKCRTGHKGNGRTQQTVHELDEVGKLDRSYIASEKRERGMNTTEYLSMLAVEATRYKPINTQITPTHWRNARQLLEPTHGTTSNPSSVAAIQTAAVAATAATIAVLLAKGKAGIRRRINVVSPLSDAGDSTGRPDALVLIFHFKSLMRLHPQQVAISTIRITSCMVQDQSITWSSFVCQTRVSSQCSDPTFYTITPKNRMNIYNMS